MCLRDLSVPGEAAPDGLRPWIQRQAYTANSYCAEAYTGIICSECSENFYRGLTGYCFQCSSIYKIPLLNVVLLLVILILNCIFWIAMFVVACHRARSLYITVSHFQLVAMLSRLGVPWPDTIQGTILFSSLLNFNLDGVHWNCLGMRASFEVRWVMEMFIPVVIVLSIYFYFYFRVWEALSHIRAAESLEQQDSGGDSATSRPATRATTAKTGAGKSVAATETAAPVKEDAAKALDRAGVATSEEETHEEENVNEDSGSEGSEINQEEEKQLQQEKLAAKQESGRDFVKLLNPKEIRKLRDAGIWYTSMSLNVLFVMASATLLIPFNCTKVSDTLHYLDAFPGFSCDSATHGNLIFFSYVLGMCWLVVFPSVQIYILRKGWYNELVMDRLFVRQFGWLFD